MRYWARPKRALHSLMISGAKAISGDGYATFIVCVPPLSRRRGEVLVAGQLALNQ